MATENPFEYGLLETQLSGLLRHGSAYTNSLGETHVYLPERLPPLQSFEATTHICKGGEYLHDVVVSHYYGLLTDPLEALEVVAQFQDDPIIDVSIPLRAGRVLLLPPMSYFQEVAWGDSLMEFPKIA